MDEKNECIGHMAAAMSVHSSIGSRGDCSPPLVCQILRLHRRAGKFQQLPAPNVLPCIPAWVGRQKRKKQTQFNSTQPNDKVPGWHGNKWVVLGEGNRIVKYSSVLSKTLALSYTDLIDLFALKKSSPGRTWVSERGAFAAGHSV